MFQTRMVMLFSSTYYWIISAIIMKLTQSRLEDAYSEPQELVVGKSFLRKRLQALGTLPYFWSTVERFQPDLISVAFLFWNQWIDIRYDLKI